MISYQLLVILSWLGLGLCAFQLCELCKYDQCGAACCLRYLVEIPELKLHYSYDLPLSEFKKQVIILYGPLNGRANFTSLS